MATNQKGRKLTEVNGSAKPRKGGSPTIYDIAALAGVNPSTVSRALNTPGRINAATEAKIREAAKSLNYQANPFARALPTGKTKMLAMILADITNPMFFEPVRGAEAAASENGYTFVIAESQESGDQEATALERVLPAVDGVVMGTSRLPDADISAMAQRKSVVLMNRKVEGVMDVVPDTRPGIVQALDHLKSLGHESLAYLSGPANSWMSDNRWSIIMTEAVSRGMKIVEIGPNEPVVAGGAKSADYVLAAGVTAILAYNDLMAIGLLGALQERGIDIPGQISVIGFDDIFGSNLTRPALTTIKSPLREAGELAVQALMLEIDGKDSTEVLSGSAKLQTSLILRASTAQAR
jgi:LacI family transcriptional regulator